MIIGRQWRAGNDTITVARLLEIDGFNAVGAEEVLGRRCFRDVALALHVLGFEMISLLVDLIDA